MSDKTQIEWTDTTWNPTTGCTRVSAGCENCYIERTPPFRIAGEKFRKVCPHCKGHGIVDASHRPCPECGGEGTWESKEIGATTGVDLWPSRLDQPLRWRKPRRVFVNSMSDLFHDDVPDEFIARVFAVMALAERHTFQVLTKRHGRMRSLLNSSGFAHEIYDAWSSIEIPGRAGSDYPTLTDDDAPDLVRLPNVWLGVSVEDQKAANLRIPALLDTPASVRFLSCEPLLGPIWLGRVDLSDATGTRYPGSIDWVICGGESGPGSRPMNPDWARSLRDQCADAEVPFFFKQWGGRTPKAGGSALDGRFHNDYPTTG